MQLRNYVQVACFYTKGLVSAMLFTVTTSIHGYAECVAPISNPSDATPDDTWKDVLTAKMHPTHNSASYVVQDIDATGTGDVNLDFYALTFDSRGLSAEWWANNFRKNLNRYIYSGTSYSVDPFNKENGDVWRSTAPHGAVLVFNLSQLAGFPLEQGAVVVSCVDSTSFIFSTVSVPGARNPGDHPVSGNRGFGFYQTSVDSITFFTKGADRLKGGNVKFLAIGSQKIFELGAKVWVGLINNLTDEMWDYHPRGRVTYKRQAKYNPPLPPDLTPPAAPPNLMIQ